MSAAHDIVNGRRLSGGYETTEEEKTVQDKRE
jgi:hypothetical protein